MSKEKHENDALKTPSNQERIEETTITYYRRVGSTIREGFESDEDKHLFLKNVFVELNKDLVKVAKCATLSRIIESVVSEAEPRQILDLLVLIIEHWTDLCTDRCASHVVQKLLAVLPKSFSYQQRDEQHTTEDTDDESRSSDQSSKEIFTEICGVVQSDLSGYITHVYASHILRTIMELLAGYRVGDQIMRSRASRKHQVTESPNLPHLEPIPELTKKFSKLSKAIFKSEKLKDYLTDPTASLVIQTLLLLQKKTESKKLDKYCRKVMKVCSLEEETESNKLPAIIENDIGSYMVECLITVASPTTTQSIHNKLFNGRTVTYAMHPVANFVLQKFLTAIADKDQFEVMFEELSPHLEDFFAVNHIGVVVKLAETCLRLGGKQEKLIKLLTKVFHCDEPKDRQSDLLRLVASVSTFEVYHQTEEKKEEAKEEEQKKPQSLQNVVYMGSLLLQTMFKFGNSKLLVDGLLKLTNIEMRNLICNNIGGHVVDAFLKSPTVGFKSRETFIQKLKGLYVEISCDKAGSRVMDNLWSVCKNYEKIFIMEELSKSEPKMMSDQFGRIISYKYGVKSFKINRNQWQEHHGHDQKKRKMFEEILGGKESESGQNKGGYHGQKKPRIQNNFEKRDTQKQFKHKTKLKS